MKAKYWITGVVVVILAVCAWFWNAAHKFAAKHGNETASATGKGPLKQVEPKLAVASLNITDIEDGKIKAISHMVLSNPLPVALTTQGLDYEVMIDSVTVIKDSYRKPITIRSSDSTSIDMPMEILAKPLGKLLKYFDDKKIDSANYSVRATMQVKVPVAGKRDFAMNMEKKLPALRIPKVKPGKININGFNLKKSGIDMVLTVQNPNVFPIKMKDGRSLVTVGKDLKMESVMQKIVNIPAKGTKEVAVHMDVKTAKLGKLAWAALFKKSKTTYNIDFSCKLLTDKDFLKNSNMAMKMNGTLEDLKKPKG